MATLKGDFIGFEYNGVHSSDLGIVRVSDGSRFNENLLPTISDKTAQVSGRDGVYFFDSQFTQKPINISIASDCLTETQYRNLRKIFGDKEIHSLVFDETPYKKYLVKVTGAPAFNFICFDEDGQRIYKGEGTLPFMAYFPYAKSIRKYLNEYSNENLDEWAASSNMIESPIISDTLELDKANGANSIYCYNGGDIETDYRLFCLFDDNKTIKNGDLNLYTIESIENLNNTTLYSILRFNDIIPIGNDCCVCFNSETKLIEGYEFIGEVEEITSLEQLLLKTRKSGNVYNRFISAGELKKMPLGFVEFNGISDSKIFIDYNYLYY